MSQLNKRWFVYMVRAKNGRLYTGITTDVNRRFSEHVKGHGAKFFRSSPAEELVFVEPCANRSQASKREYLIKSSSKAKKLALIASKVNQVLKP